MGERRPVWGSQRKKTRQGHEEGAEGETRLQDPCSSFSWEAGGRSYNADPGWVSGRTNSRKQNRGCFPKPENQRPGSSAEDGEAELRVRAGSAGEA